jgi:Uma2 family endonuclease
MSAVAKRPPSIPAPVPILEPGDHLTRDEFERRYNAMPEVKKAELIEGVVHMASPVRWSHHAYPHTRLVGWLTAYDAQTPGVQTGDNATLRLDLDNLPQPDGVMLILPSHGGQATFSADDFVVTGPELAAEISASTVSTDLHEKFRVYRRNGVREYIVWRVQDAAIDWFVLRGTQYDPLQPDATGILKSEVFPGLWLDADALTRFDLATVLKVLQQGLAHPDHAAFVLRLHGKGRSTV